MRRIELRESISYFIIGLAIAFVGLFVSDFFGSLFNGMDYGSACVLGMGAYLCAVVVICTCIIISKLDGKSKSDNDDKKTE